MYILSLFVLLIIKTSFINSISNIKSINNSSHIVKNKRYSKKCIDQWYEIINNNNDLNSTLWLKNHGTIDIEDVFISFTSRLATLFQNNFIKCSDIYYLQIGIYIHINKIYYNFFFFLFFFFLLLLF
jgi:hypothetical protein